MKNLRAIILPLLVVSCTQLQAKSFITIGTGGVTGVYYPTGGAICSMVNKNRKSHAIRCNVESTGGSVYNANSLLKNEIDLGIIQSDIGDQAWNGKGPFSKRNKQLRSIFSIYSESLTLVARKDSKINSLTDLKGKKVNIGNPGSGTRRTVEALFSECGISNKDLKLAGELKPAEMPDALRDKKLDAYFYVVGHPTANIKDISISTEVKLIPLEGTCIQSLLDKFPYYVKTLIPEKLYRGNDQAVPSFGVKATLLTSSKLDAKVSYEITKAIFENLERFKQLHPSYKFLNSSSMLEGLSAPIHSGAEKYFLEKKLIQKNRPKEKNLEKDIKPLKKKPRPFTP